MIEFVEIPAPGPLGGRIEYRWIGARDGRQPVLVFLHEGLGSVGQWRDFPDAVAADCGLPALVYSRIGYGASSPCALPRPITYMHDEALHQLPDLLRVLGIERPILVGHSDGASIALIHAGAAPRGAAPHPGLLGIAVMAPHSYGEAVAFGSIQAAHQAYESGDLRARLAKYHGDNVDCAFRGWCDSWLNPAFRAWNIEAEVARIKHPVLAIQGEGDEYGTLAQLDTIKALAKGRVETLILPDCGHSPHKDQPAAVRVALAEYVRSLLQGGASSR